MFSSMAGPLENLLNDWSPWRFARAMPVKETQRCPHIAKRICRFTHCFSRMPQRRLLIMIVDDWLGSSPLAALGPDSPSSSQGSQIGSSSFVSAAGSGRPVQCWTRRQVALTFPSFPAGMASICPMLKSGPRRLNEFHSHFNFFSSPVYLCCRWPVHSCLKSASCMVHICLQYAFRISDQVSQFNERYDEISELIMTVKISNTKNRTSSPRNWVCATKLGNHGSSTGLCMFMGTKG